MSLPAQEDGDPPVGRRRGRASDHEESAPPAIAAAARDWGSAVPLATHDPRVNDIASRQLVLAGGVLAERHDARACLLHAAGC